MGNTKQVEFIVPNSILEQGVTETIEFLVLLNSSKCYFEIEDSVSTSRQCSI